MLVSWEWAEENDLLEGLGNLQENGKEDLLLPVAEQHQQPKGFQPILLTCSGPALPTSCLLHSGSRGMWLLLRLCLHSLQDTGGQLQDLGSLLVVYTSVLKQRGLVTSGGKGLGPVLLLPTNISAEHACENILFPCHYACLYHSCIQLLEASSVPRKSRTMWNPEAMSLDPWTSFLLRWPAS